jgi:hypothetical protein
MPHNGAGAATPGKGSGSEKINDQATASITPMVPPAAGSPPLAWAIYYASRGWRVIKADLGKKFPTLPKWQDKATATDWNQIIAWWTEDPRANVCIVTGRESNLWVLDIDDAPAWKGKPAKEGSKTLADLERELGPLPGTFTVRTRTGGRHMYFTYAGVDFEMKNAVGQSGPLGKDLDIRAQGGQVAAPSWAAEDANGAAGRYEVINNTPPAACPKAWIDRLRPKAFIPPPPQQRTAEQSASPFDQPGCGRRYERPDVTYRQDDGSPSKDGFTSCGVSALKSAQDNIRNAPDGTQNDTINKEAHGMGGLFLSGQLGRDAEWVKAQLLQAADEGNHPRHRAVATIESGWNSATPRTIAPRMTTDFRRKP